MAIQRPLGSLLGLRQPSATYGGTGDGSDATSLQEGPGTLYGTRPEFLLQVDAGFITLSSPRIVTAAIRVSWLIGVGTDFGGINLWLENSDSGERIVACHWAIPIELDGAQTLTSPVNLTAEQLSVVLGLGPYRFYLETEYYAWYETNGFRLHDWWIDDGGVPPLRQVQRDDGLGRSVMRARGTHSVQKSIRQRGYR